MNVPRLTVSGDGRSLSEAAVVNPQRVPRGRLLRTLGNGGKGRRDGVTCLPQHGGGTCSLTGTGPPDRRKGRGHRRVVAGARGMPTWPEDFTGTSSS